ncbi:MAG TPA: hypothetical protein PK440_07940 [Candidatus Accumulibacter phosphatis]|nr:MAG: hypothetical protein AW07_03147 [Candidatus Accumulibacter sp. SK-11]HAY29355.1 hypothetical protein [Accumulibacter sp.]HRL76320.1 hypothetical protein [Candidatus Accumulibacter phosphatis]HRQ94916.1 hypothetical protein [Candidatus Accumulibacter phosphatis]
MVDLLFSDGPGSLDLVFGSTGTPPVIIVLGSACTVGAATMAGVLESGALPLGSAGPLPGSAGTSAIAISDVPALSMPAILNPGIADLAISYDNAVNRGPFPWAGASWQGAAALSRLTNATHHASAAGEATVVVGCGSGSPLATSLHPRWQLMGTSQRPASRFPWGAGAARRARFGDRWGQLARHLRPSFSAPFNEAAQRARDARDGWIELFQRARPELVASWGPGANLSFTLAVVAGAGLAYGIAGAVPWQQAMRPPHGRAGVPVDPPGPPGYVPATDLLFCDAAPASLGLVFGRPCIPVGPIAAVVIPVRRSYVVINEVALVRTDNQKALAPLSLSVSIDADSWVWGWQASLPASSIADVLPGAPGAPVEFEATINGVSWLLLAEGVTRDRRFAQARITVSGRGIAAELGAPYAASVSRSNLADLTARQLMEAALTINAVPIGWSVDWQIVDWLVSAGAWSHTGSHIEAVTRIAQAAGGYVQASHNSRSLEILPRYPFAPWDWGGVTPAFSLPSAATTRESIEWREKPAYNAVYVSGEGAGVLARIKRAGTAGDRVAPMITDSLTTHVDAARQRGLSILSDVGQQQLLTLDTPLFSGVGIYPVGSFVRFVDGADSRIGIVRSLSISAALPKVRQIVELECHG